MDDFDDTILSHAFADLRDEVGPQVRPAGIGAAQQTVRQRRRVRVTVIAAAIAVLALVVPAGAFAALGAGPGRTPQVGTSTSPSPSSPSPSGSDSSSPAPDGHITHDQLKNAKLTVPRWPADAGFPNCISGKVTFSGWSKFINEGESMSLRVPVYVDVDGDHAEETLVLLQCGTDSTGSQQVLALDRDAAGNIVTIGAVAVQTGAVKSICGVRPGADGSVDVQVVDFMIAPSEECTPRQAPYAIFQWRTYHLVGGAFRQTGGKTGFPANRKVSDLTVSASNLIFTASGNGTTQTGTMRVTVRNNGNAALPFTITLQLVNGTTVSAPANCVKTDYPQVTNVDCPVASVAPGASKTLTITLSIDAPATPDFLPRVVVHPADGYADPDMSNNEARFSITYQ
jgi:hypothetical protein